jgi:hypothetical protein
MLSGEFRFFQLLATFVLQAWDAREAAFNESESLLETPQIVLSIRQRLAANVDHSDARQPHDAAELGSTGHLMSTTTGCDVYNVTHSMDAHNDHTFSGLGSFADVLGLAHDVQMDYVDWSAINWDMGNASINETGATRDQEQ